MTTDEQMAIDECYKYLRMMQNRYRKATTRQEKHQRLNENGGHDDLASQISHSVMGQTIMRKSRRRKRNVTYDPDALSVTLSFDLTHAQIGLGIEDC
jgi:predicted nucleic acid-binding Zn ribbon protein